MIDIVKADGLFLEEVNLPPVELTAEDYLLRIRLLRERMEKLGLTHVVIYGDREHFANIEYFTRYDCRFEEALFILDGDGEMSVLVGNEGMGFSEIIPYPVHRYLYQNFSLQGQPRDRSETLGKILARIGLNADSRTGIVGYKYYEKPYITTEPERTFDLPHYILEEILAVCPDVRNITEEITGVPDGIRMKLHSAREIAWAESAGNRCAAVIQRMIKNLRPGLREYELPMAGGVGFEPRSMHPIVNFGASRVALGMDSPGTSVLETGEVCGLCYGIRGCLTSRVAIAAHGPEDCGAELKPYMETFYKKYYEAVAAWYETARVGATGGELYQAVMSLIGGPEFGVALNPGHHTGCDEWSNSAIREGSGATLADGAFMQVDIIASGSDPVRTSICEDAVVIAGEALRTELAGEFPEVHERILRRQETMRRVLGLDISSDVLPMNNLTGVYFPYMLNPSLVFGKREG